MAAGARVPYGEADLYCAGKDLAKALAVRIPVGAVPTTPWRYRGGVGRVLQGVERATNTDAANS